MENHIILLPALQKYYSALKSLNEFGFGDNFFDDVASLDTFFSEFRNITFVIQKGLKTEENKEKYTKLRDAMLYGDTLKWFIESRNKTIKEKPFPLKKGLVINVYLPHETIRLNQDNLTVDFDETFEDVLNGIKSIFITKLKLIEVFFSVQIRFFEEYSEVDLYPKIKCGLIQMNEFMQKIKEKFPCDCKECSTLSDVIKKIYGQVIGKEITFVRDYAYEMNKELMTGENAEMYMGNSESDYTLFSDIRIPLRNILRIGEEKEEIHGDINIFEAFFKFVIMHTICFQQQDHNIMPVFSIIFSDDTCRMIPFIPSTKTTFYRKINEIVEHTDFTDVKAVFYCGEYYFYQDSPEVWQKPYSERRKMAEREILTFRMFLKNCGEWHIDFDESKIDDIDYVKKQTQDLQKTEDADNPIFDWFSPIKEKMNLYKKESENI